MAELPETMLQFGAGRFLRAFVDRFVHEANEAGQAVGRVVVVQSTAGQRAELLRDQPQGFHVLVRGYEEGRLVERAERVQSISRALIAADDWSRVLEVATSPDLKYVVSNATEAGYALAPGEALTEAAPQSLPAKLAHLLYARFVAQAEPVVLLPCELIERNASRLLELVVQQAERWQLPPEFCHWVRGECLWLNNLVDCIVTRGPEDHALTATDPLLISAEPYRLWAIEKPVGRTAPLFTHPAIRLVDDLAPFYLRKVRMLNGVHSAMTARFLPAGFAEVQEVLENSEGNRWVRDLLFEEIVPTLAYRLPEVAAFADAVYDRLRNPYLHHKLADIALNHADKVKVRLEPTRDEYTRLFGRPPEKIAAALATRLS